MLVFKFMLVTSEILCHKESDLKCNHQWFIW